MLEAAGVDLSCFDLSAAVVGREAHLRDSSSVELEVRLAAEGEVRTKA